MKKKKKNQQTRTIKTPILYRTGPIDRAEVNEETREVNLSFSSEEPVSRWFGDEILDHDKKSVDLSFADSGRAPLLKDHNREVQTGVVEKAYIGKDRKGRAQVRFGKSAVADEEFNDVNDGIRSNVSVGYRINKMVLEESSDEGGDVYRATDWTPLEISIVSIPADQTVGIGREGGAREFETEIIYREVIDMTPEELKKKADAEAKAKADAEAQAKAITVAREEETGRVSDILALGEMHNLKDDAMKAMKDGKSVDQFRQFVLDKLAERNLTPTNSPNTELGLTDREVNNFSIMKAARAIAYGGQYVKEAGFELECSRAIADRLHKEPQGFFVPMEVQKAPLARDMQTMVATQGGYLVDTVLAVASFIETLENAMVVESLGAIILRDLVGDLAIPKQTGGATSYWVGEGEDVTESTPALGQVQLRPKTVGAFTDLTRKFILQSSLSAEAFVRGDLALRLALAIDLASINGLGAANEPLGILNTTGIGSTTLNAANTPDWGDIVDMEKELAVDNALSGSMAYVTNATIIGNMKQTEKASGYPVYIMADDGSLNSYRCLLSNQVPAKHIIFGNWNDLIIGYWGALDVNIDTATLSKSGGLRIVCLQDIDVAVRHAESFVDGYKA